MTFAERLRRYLNPGPIITTSLVSHTFSEEPWTKLHVIMTLAGHKPSSLADAGGGYLCACQRASWSSLDEYGPYGGCPKGWYDAREFLARHGVPSEVDFDAARRHHQFGHRNGLTKCSHDDPLCRKYGCPDDPNWKGDQR